MSVLYVRVCFVEMEEGAAPLRVAVLGYGGVGRALCQAVLEQPPRRMVLAAVWNRSAGVLPAAVARGELPPGTVVLADVAELYGGGVACDVAVEAAHPDVTAAHAAALLARGVAVYCGSPTVFARPAVEAAVRAASARTGASALVPAGALWGAADLQKLAARGGLAELRLEMRFHPRSIRLPAEDEGGDKDAALGAARDALRRAEASGAWPCVLYDGPVRGLCALAPNNVNTMAAACLAVHPALGFDSVRGVLVAEPLDAHVVVVDARGPPRDDGLQFSVSTRRVNPAVVGAVTGSATYASFVSSLLAVERNRGLLRMGDFVFV
jgi:aspartate dehydrogenase